MPPITDNGIVHLVASRSVNEVLVHLLSILQTKVISVFAVVDHSGEAAKVHTHAVIFNVTERENGQTRALQPRELFVSQNYATNVYRSELAARLRIWDTPSSAASLASRRSRDTRRSIWKPVASAGNR
jgi:hypothetical protein